MGGRSSRVKPKLLNPMLYRLLRRRFGEQNVQVRYAGEPFVGGYRYYEGRLRLHKDFGGEEYYLNCPLCSDTRNRLSINHRWGLWDDRSRSNNLWLINCYNEQCFQRCHEERVRLYEQLYTQQAARASRNLQLAPVQKAVSERLVSGAAKQPPGPVTRLDELLQTHPRHAALLFLQDRQFDPAYLGKRYGVGYCWDSPFRFARQRIYIPVYCDRKLVGWQARCVGLPEHKRVPKYWTAPGMRRSQAPYNFDVAKKYQTLVLVEGPADVWRFGAPAVGIMGKSVSLQLVRRIQSECKGLRSVVVLLDPKQDAQALSRGQEHHIERAVRALRSLELPVVPVYLPEHLDPGDADQQYLHEMVREAGRQAGVPVVLRKVR